MAGYQYRGTEFDAGGRAKGRKPIRHGTTKGQYNRCKERELGACAECRDAAARDEARRRAANDPRNTILKALQAFAQLGDAA
jgi:hypothetical protein